MPRIPPARSAGRPGAVVTMPRAREVSPLATPPANIRPAPTMSLEAAGLVGRSLQQFGQVISGSIGVEVLNHIVRQEIETEGLRVHAEAEQRWGELRAQVDGAGTAADARRLWERQAPVVKAGLDKFASDRGLPQARPKLGLIASQIEADVRSSLGKRAAGEGVDAIQSYAEAKLEAMVNAPSEVEARRHRVELHRALEAAAVTNPLITAGDADQLFNRAVQDAAHRRVTIATARASNNPAALRQLSADLQSGLFEDLPADAREVAAARAIDAAERSELHQLSMLDRAEAIQERQARRAREDRAAQLRVSLMRGELTEQALVAEVGARSISNDEFDGLLRAMRTEGAQRDDPPTALALRDGIYAGVVTGADVLREFRNGNLSQSSAEELMSLDDQVARRGGDSILDRDDVKRARRFLNDTIGGLRGPLAVLDADESARVANGLREFDARVQAGDDPWQVADQLAAQFRTTPPAVTSFGRPMFLVGTPAAPDIEASIAATIAAFNRGEIDQTTAAREIERIERMERAAADRDALSRSATTVSPRPR
jgi:hypothetical protein